PDAGAARVPRRGGHLRRPRRRRRLAVADRSARRPGRLPGGVGRGAETLRAARPRRRPGPVVRGRRGAGGAVRGETVTIVRRAEAGRDAHGNTTWAETEVAVAGCVVW